MIVELDEYGPFVRWPGSRDSLRTLLDESRRWKAALGTHQNPIAVTYNGSGRAQIRAEGVAGYLNAGEACVEIRPKFLADSKTDAWRNALWKILILVEDHPLLGAPVPAIHSLQQSLPDLLGWILLEGIRLGAHEGLPRGYNEASGWLPVLKGRLDASRIDQIWSRPGQIPCLFDEYSHNTVANRLLRWASQALAATVQSAWLAQELLETAAIFADVDRTPPGVVEADMIRLPVQQEFLAPAIQAARLILRAEYLTHGLGAQTAPSFLWNSAGVFERFVRHLLSRVTECEASWVLDRPNLLMGTPDRTLPLTRSRLWTHPDYLIRREGTAPVVVDAKYKRWSRAHQPRSPDTYQVIAGGRISRASHGILVYPQPDHRRKRPLRWRVLGDGAPDWLCCLFVDLSLMDSEGGEDTLLTQFGDDLQNALS